MLIRKKGLFLRIRAEKSAGSDPQEAMPGGICLLTIGKDLLRTEQRIAPLRGMDRISPVCYDRFRHGRCWSVKIRQERETGRKTE